MQCTAHRRNGDPCGSHAVKGGTVCRMHGGSSPQARAKAAERVAVAKAAKTMRLFAAPVDIDPAHALLELVQWTAGEVRYWRAEVERIAVDEPANLTWGRTSHTEGEGPQGYVNQDTTEAVPHIAYRMLTDAQDRLAKYAAAALRAGVEERRVRLAEDQGMLVAQVIRAVLDDLQLTSEQTERVPEIVPRHLRLLAGNAA